MGSRYLTSLLPLPRSACSFALALAALSACSLTKKEDDASTAATAAVAAPAAPVFTVAVPQGTEPAALAPNPVAEKVATAKGKTAAGGASSTHSATGTTPASTTHAGGTTSAATTAKAATGGTTAKATTAAAAPTLPQVDMACLNGCATKLQACITGAGIDPTKLTACQGVLTTCQAECKK